MKLLGIDMKLRRTETSMPILPIDRIIVKESAYSVRDMLYHARIVSELAPDPSSERGLAQCLVVALEELITMRERDVEKATGTDN